MKRGEEESEGAEGVGQGERKQEQMGRGEAGKESGKLYESRKRRGDGAVGEENSTQKVKEDVEKWEEKTVKVGKKENIAEGVKERNTSGVK